MEETDREFLLHVLRNPSGWNDEVIRGVRVQAADELERLWAIERASKFALSRAIT